MSPYGLPGLLSLNNVTPHRKEGVRYAEGFKYACGRTPNVNRIREHVG